MKKLNLERKTKISLNAKTKNNIWSFYDVNDNNVKLEELGADKEKLKLRSTINEAEENLEISTKTFNMGYDEILKKFQSNYVEMNKEFAYLKPSPSGFVPVSDPLVYYER